MRNPPRMQRAAGHQFTSRSVARHASAVGAYTLTHVKRNLLIVLVACAALVLGPRRGRAQGMCTSNQGLLSATPCPDNTTAATGSSGSVSLTLMYSGMDIQTYNATCSDDGTVVTSCGFSGPPYVTFYGSGNTNFVVTFSTTTAGTGQVFLTFNDPSNFDQLQVTITVTVTSHQFALTPGETGHTEQLRSACASACFNGTASYSTVPFYTMDAPQRVTLVHNEDRAHPRPIIAALVQPTGTAPATPTQYVLGATLNGAAVNFINGDAAHQVYFSGGSSAERLAAQFDAGSYATGVYSLVVTVTAKYSDNSTTQQSYSMPLVIDNERDSPFGRGWTIAGVQRMYFTDNGYLVTNGGGDAEFFTGLGQSSGGLDYTWLTYDSNAQQYSRYGVDSSRMVFNSSGQMIAVYDRTGAEQLAVAYDANGRPSSISSRLRISGDTSVPFIQLRYGPYNRLSAISDTGGSGAPRRTAITINSDSDLTVIADPAGGTVQYAYDSNGRLATVTDRRAGVTTFAYDATTWKLASVSAPTIPIDAGGGSTTNGNPVTTDTPWETNGVPTAPTSASSPSAAGVSDPYAYMYDPLKHVAKWDVNSFGQARNTVDPLNQTTTVNYDSVASRIPLPAITQYPSGDADSIWYVSGTPLIAKLHLRGDSVVNFLYGVKAQVDSIWGPGRTAEYRGYTPDGVLQWIRYGATSSVNDGVVANFAYNGLGQVTSYTDPGTHKTTYSYDAATGNTDSVATPGGPFSRLRFDSYGRDTLSSATGQLAVRTLYDVLGRVHAAWHVGVTNDTVTTSYDSLYPVRVQGPGGETYKVEVNALGWVTKRYDSGDTTRYESFRYDSAGDLTSYTNRRGQEVDMTYDAVGHLLTRGGPGVVADTFGYSPDGLRLTSVRKNVERDSTFLSALGRPDSVVRLVAGHRYAITYEYDAYPDTAAGGRVIVRMSNNAGLNLVPLAFNTHNRYPATDSIVVNGASSTLIRDQDGLDKSTKWPIPGLYYHWQHTANHQPYFVEFDSSGILNDSLARSFEFDSAGRVVNDWRWAPDGNTSAYLKRHFMYDTLGQLLKVSVAQISASCSSVGTDTLVLGESITCANTTPIGTQDSASYDTKMNRLFPGAVYSSTGNQLLQGPAGWTYSYDADRNLTTRTHNGVVDSLFWSPTGLLDSVASGTLHHWYEYNTAGQLVRRQTRMGANPWAVDRYFLWDESNMLAELDYPGTHRRAQYLYSGVDQPFAIATDSAAGSRVQYFYGDPEGNLSAIINLNGISQLRHFGAWGEFLGDSINTLADTNRLGWKGLMYEADSTRLYYVRNRWYDPTSGRFVSEDPIGINGGLNLYAFAGNDPIEGSDATGTSDENTQCFDVYSVLTFVDGTQDWAYLYSYCKGSGGTKDFPAAPGGGGDGDYKWVHKSYQVTTKCAVNAKQVMGAVESNFGRFGDYSILHGLLGVTFSPQGAATPGARIPIVVRTGWSNHLSVNVESMNSRNMTFTTNPGHLFYPGEISFSASDVTPGTINFSIHLSGYPANFVRNVEFNYGGADAFENAQWHNFLNQVVGFCKGGK